MSGSTGQVLEEYLIRLGFKTDLISQRKFEDSLGSAGKRVFQVGTTVAGVVASVEAAAAAFAYSMRKVYFDSELANSSAKNLQSMGFAAKQFGLSEDTMTGALKNMAQAMRSNPGLQGLIESFGIQVTGRDTADVMLDYVKALKQMPEFAGAQYAGLFGMDPETFHLMREHLDEFIAKREKLARLQRESGVDIDAQKKQMLEYTEAMDTLAARFALIGQKWLSSIAPMFTDSTSALNQFLNGLIEVGDKLAEGRIGGYLYGLFHGKGWYEKGSRMDKLLNGDKPTAGKNPMATGVISGATATRGTIGKQALLSGLEEQYGLPKGLLDRVWAQESGRGKNMRSKAGAKGDFQFMDATAAQYGITNPDDFNQSSVGAAKMYANLLKKYKGDTSLALAAYNWGEGNVDAYLKTGKGLKGQAMPQETRDYVRKIAGGDARLGGQLTGQTIVQNNNVEISVTGTGAEATAAAVGRAQSRVLGDATRNLKGSVG